MPSCSTRPAAVLALVMPLAAVAQEALPPALPPALPGELQLTLPRVLASGSTTHLPAPADDTPHGAAWTGKVVWLACGERLFRLRWPDLAVELQLEAPPGIVDLCADERHVYALRHEDLLLLDAISGRPVHTVPLDLGGMSRAASEGRPGRRALRPTAIGRSGNRLAVLASGELFALDRLTGEHEHLGKWHLPAGNAVHWLAHDGHDWIVGDDREVGRLEAREDPPQTPARYRAEWSTAVTRAAGTCIGEQVLLFVRAPGIDGFPSTTAHLFRPTFAPPPLLVRMGTTGDTRWWQVARERGNQLVDLERALRTRRTLALQDAANHGQKVEPAVVLVPLPGTPVSELRLAWQHAIAAGYTDITCPGLAATLAAMGHGPATKDR